MITFCLEEYLKEKSTLVEGYLNSLLPLQHSLQKELYKAARYAVLEGGKRLRPLFCLAVAELYGVHTEVALPPACALELIHCYSLVHDDLPCMDDDDYRRGKPTVHRKFSEDVAVLTGDFLLTYAFEVLVSSKGLSAETKLHLTSVLARRIGGEGMIGGQLIDTRLCRPLTLEELVILHSKKTGALLKASFEFGALIANAPKEELTLWKSFGEKIGLAFQIVDDILDVTASEKKHGCKVASDLKKDKTTFYTLLGIEAAKEYAEERFKSAMKDLELIPRQTETIKELARYIIDRTY